MGRGTGGISGGAGCGGGVRPGGRVRVAPGRGVRACARRHTPLTFGNLLGRPSISTATTPPVLSGKAPMNALHRPVHPVRLVTASALFDGHDASINIMRRIFQSQGAEVIHLGHNRSVKEVVDAAIEEDVQGIAVSSYQGGHVEYFEYLVESLREQGAGHIHVVGGGGGVIVPEEIARLRDSGVTIFSPEDGQRLGLTGMINQVVADCDFDLTALGELDVDAVVSGDRAAIARAITHAEAGALSETQLGRIRAAAASHTSPVLGITGTG